MKDEIFDKIYNALKITPGISFVGVIIFIVAGLITNMNKDLILLITWGVLVITVAIIWLVSRICMEIDIDEDEEEEKDR
jgi:hypothetical protein